MVMDMSLSREITFCGYRIIANARLATADDWVGGYVVVKDDHIVRIQFSVVWRDTAEAAVSAALVFGIQFVDRCQLKLFQSGSTSSALSVSNKWTG
jgi:hypothetical protein